MLLSDAGYGVNTAFREDVTALGLVYAVGINPTTTVWPPGTAPLPPKKWKGNGRPPKNLQRNAKHKPLGVKTLAQSLPASEWRTVTWREGVDKDLTSRFARLRVRAAHNDRILDKPRSEEWLVIEWPEGEKAPIKYWLSTLPENTSFDTLIDTIKLRWRIERDYQELKQEVGLGHYEGRSWRGFHHHATLCIAAYGFLISEKGDFPPSQFITTASIKKFAVPDNYRPRGAASACAASR